MSDHQEASESGPETIEAPSHTSRVASPRLKWIAIIVGIIATVSIAYGVGYLMQKYQGGVPTATHQSLANDGNRIVTSDEDAIAKVAADVSPSVVSITTRASRATIFGSSESEGAGTGIIVSAEGYILTNKHVVNGANALAVITADGARYTDVKVIGNDPLNDVAFIKVQGAKDLTAAKIGDSSTVRVGQRVVAIGNSLGQYQNTVTSGIISGVGRPVAAQAGNSIENLVDLLQTDAAINPGNSGGPLLNLAGQVIGINTAIATNAQGIGFSIPINATKGMMKGVVAGKGIERALLGVRYLPITPEVAKKYSLTVTAGAYVYSEDGSQVVQVDGPADKAGIKIKDVITKVNGLEIGPRGGVTSLVAEYQPGDTIALNIIRDGREQTLHVTLGSYR